MVLQPHRPASLSALGIVIPALNAAAGLAACLDALAGRAGDIVVVDGGSRDATRTIALAHGARLVDSPAGRGRQLAAGALAVRGDWLLFLHADTVLQPGWADAAARFLQGPTDRAGYFHLAFDQEGGGAARVSRLANWRARVLGLPYGDQGLLIHRDFHQALGGYPDEPLMEDVILVRRIGRGRLAPLDATARTSAARYRRDGWWLRPLRNLSCLALYFMGLPPRLIARLYA